MRKIIYTDTDSKKVIGWILDTSGSLICGTCGCEVMPFEIEKGQYNFCPNCGADNCGCKNRGGYTKNEHFTI